MFFVFGAHAFIWGTTAITIRQRSVPSELRGRVGRVKPDWHLRGLVVGAGIGGLLARRWGVTAPIWVAFVGSAIFVCVIRRELRHVAHDEPSVRPGTR